MDFTALGVCFISWHCLNTCYWLFSGSGSLQHPFQSLRSQRLLGGCSVASYKDTSETLGEVGHLVLSCFVFFMSCILSASCCQRSTKSLYQVDFLSQLSKQKHSGFCSDPKRLYISHTYLCFFNGLYFSFFVALKISSGLNRSS